MPKKPNFGRSRPEAKIQKALKTFLKARDWLVESTHGSAFQRGFPDLFLAHPKWGIRWVDVKVEGRYSFTKAQRIKWPLWERYGVGIWVLTAANQENYDRLFAPPNWRSYWKSSWELPTIDDVLAQFDH